MIQRYLQTLGVVVLLVVALASTGTPALAGDLIFGGQEHAYSVIFRGNGEAIVFGRLVFTNTGDQPQTELRLDAANVSVSEFVAYQQILPPSCIEYTPGSRSSRTCVTYGEPDYAGGAVSSGDSSQYQAVSYDNTEGEVVLKLPVPIAPDKSSAVILAYASRSYTDPHWGNYFTYDFETLTVEERVRHSSVTIDVASELFLKGDRSRVNYSEDYLMDDLAMGEVSDAASLSVGQLDTLSQRIGSSGSIYKTSSNLAAGDTLEVRGAYGPTWLRVHVSSFVWAFVIIAAVIAAAYGLGRAVKKRHRKHPEQTHASVFPTHLLNDLVYVMVGLIASAVAVGTTVFLTYLLEEIDFFQRAFDSAPVAITAAIAMCLYYALVLFGPGVLLAMKHGWKALVFTVMAEFAWLLVFLVIYIGLFQPLGHY